VFKICLSIEKEVNAHRTLELRSFFRQFPYGGVPEEYYQYIRGELSREKLFETFREQAKAAKKEAWKCELSEGNARRIDERITYALSGSSNWVLIGGPPCQAYSLVGRNRMRGEDAVKFEKDHRHFLYREYLRILDRHRPAVFIMENVKGLLSARVNGKNIFTRILKDLSSAGKGYNLYPLEGDLIYESSEAGDFIVHSERYGIPQARHRVFILGVSQGVNFERDMLTDKPERIPMWDAVRDLPKIRSGLSKEEDSPSRWISALKEFSSDLDTAKTVSVDVAGKIDEVCSCLVNARYHLTRGDQFMSEDKGTSRSKWLERHCEWFIDERIKGYCNHEAKSHIREDIFRYMYAACFAAVRKSSPRISDFPQRLRPAHRNVKEAAAGKMFSDRFRVQLKDRPATTIVSHIAKDGHYFIHPDPVQCRSLTVREAARLQTFPDNYFFEGGRTAQYVQVGNAVPPLLARQIADIVKNIF
jgi:DNA (cytosine-5)-methyltransferase 1